MPRTIPYGRQTVEEDDIAAVVEVLRGDYLTTGPAVPAFERALAKSSGASHAVALNSGTSALHAMYHAAGIGPGDEIVTSPLTFAATANAALYLGATVRFVDVEPDTGSLDVEQVQVAITADTAAIVPVDFAGHPAAYAPLRTIAERHGAMLLADAAHSLGATYRGEPVGTLADASAFSFHPVKPITTAEGGAVVTDDAAFASRVERFRSHGITRDPNELEAADEGAWWYEQHVLGFNYRLTDLQAALGASQLGKLDRFVDRRRDLAAAYDEGLKGVQGLLLPGRRDDVEPGWHLYVVRTREPERRRALFERLHAQGLAVQVHYLPVYWHPYYTGLGYRRGMCPNAEAFYRSAVSLPLFPSMSDEDVMHCIDVVRASCADVLGSVS